jgi:hypothetical protein
LIYDVGQRALIGGVAGFASSFFLFKTWSLRMFFMFTGLGVGLGMNYSQMNVHYRANVQDIEGKYIPNHNLYESGP